MIQQMLPSKPLLAHEVVNLVDNWVFCSSSRFFQGV